MERYCDSPFWDVNSTWNTGDPDFTECFEQTVILWPVCAFLWVTAAFDFCLVRSSDSVYQVVTWRTPGWTRLAVIKVFNIAIVTCMEIVTLLAWLINAPTNVLGVPDVVWISPVVIIATNILSGALVYFHKSRYIHTSGIQLIYWTLLSIVHLILFRTEVSHLKGSSLLLSLRGISCAIMIFQAVCFCWSDIPSPKPGDHSLLVDDNENNGDTKIVDSPELQASCLSSVLFSYSTPLVISGYKRALTKEDLWGLPHSMKAKPVTLLFEQAYGKSEFGEIRGIWRNLAVPLWKTCGWTLVTGNLCRLATCLLEFLSPKLMGYLIDFVSDAKQEDWKGYMWASLLFVNYICFILFFEQFFLRMFKIDIIIKNCLSFKIYQKSLRVSSESRKEISTGEIVNLMSVDVPKISSLAVWGSEAIWASPVQITIGIWLLYEELGPSIFARVCVLCAVIPINAVLTVYSSKYQKARMKAKDERIKTINEILSAIQTIKLYAWEPSFVAQAQKLRSEEIRYLRKRAIIESSINLLFNSIPFFVSTAAFTAFVIANGSSALGPKEAFIALSLFNILTDPITNFPNFISQVIDAAVSSKRINRFLNANELQEGATKFEESSGEVLPAVEIVHGTFSWDKTSTCLNDINFSAESGKLTVIVGRVASGKSSLLSAILGEMLIDSRGTVVVRSSKIAYAPQIPWIINATLRENICFGLPFEGEKYDQILDACCLAPDLEILPAGDLTEIGEKGINLSGGQKQRVSLARAVYSGAEILLLDDVLSAVDAHVGKQIFDKLLGSQGLLAGRTRILVTHAFNFLSQADGIVVMSEGTIVEAGTYFELMASGGVLSELSTQQIQSRGHDSNDDDDLLGHNDSQVKKKGDNRGRLIEDEELQTGDVKLADFKSYIQALKYPYVIGVLIFVCASQGMDIGRNIVLSHWTNTASSAGPSTTNYLLQYAALGLSESVAFFIGFVLLVIATLTASRTLHDNMMSRIIRAPMSFFNVTLVGRIVNQFSSDVEALDIALPRYIGYWISRIFKLVGIFVTISYTNPYFIVFAVPLCIAYYILQQLFVKCTRQLQRILSSLDSPIYSQFSETLNGTSTIRAYRAEERFSSMLANKMDEHNRAAWPQVIVSRWLSIRAGLLGSSVVFITALFAVIWRHDISPSLAGLSITYTLQLYFIMCWFIKVSCYVQTNFVSVERILQYSKVNQEAELQNPLNPARPNWPERGSIEFVNYETRYRPGLDVVLKQLSCKINPGEKIGIVGRTGAGKSSLTLALFRIIEAIQGQILVDAVNIESLGLHDLRQRLTVIPQDPVLFARPLRLNLDPFQEYRDDQLWQALELAHLKPYVESLAEGLDYQIDEGGGNLSVGQRQLVCLARAILRKSNILVLDEATASVDTKTDELIQETIRSTFKDCTILNVAHRLNTVMDSTRIMVLSRGEMIEFDSPAVLLADPTSQFYGMAKNAGFV